MAQLRSFWDAWITCLWSQGDQISPNRHLEVDQSDQESEQKRQKVSHSKSSDSLRI